MQMKLKSAVAASVVTVSLLFCGAVMFSGKPEKLKDVQVKAGNIETASASFSDKGSSQARVSASYTIKRMSPDPSRVLWLATPVVEDVVDTLNRQLVELDKQSDKPIWLYIDSPGGSVFAGTKLIGQMQSLRSPVHTVCVSICASMAAVIHQHGTQRLSTNHAVLMFHPISGGFQGELPQMESRMRWVKRTGEKMNAYIVSRSKMGADEFSRLERNEFWVDAQDSLEFGLIDNVAGLNVSLGCKPVVTVDMFGPVVDAACGIPVLEKLKENGKKLRERLERELNKEVTTEREPRKSEPKESVVIPEFTNQEKELMHFLKSVRN